MKRWIAICAACVLALGLPMSMAAANSWGLTGDLLEAVSAVHTWDDYYAISDQIGDIALMHSRYHNALMLLSPDSGALYAYTKAVYQPGDGHGGEAKLQKSDGGFTLRYGDSEWYTFALQDNAFILQEAVIGGFSMVMISVPGDGSYYSASEGGQTVLLWRRSYPLDAFNIQLFPRSVEEVRHINHMRAALDSGQQCLGWSDYPDNMPDYTKYAGVGSGTQPVYSAPFGDAAWRAANGKAAVGLGGEIWLLKTLRTTDGSPWVCIRYDVSQRTQRIGYIPASVLGVNVPEDDSSRDLLDRFLSVSVQANRDTYLTDDPDVSQFPQLPVPKGTAFTCLGLFGNDYAYVAASVKDGQFADNGSVVWGFVPLKALSFPEGDAYRSPQTDVMASIIGEWVFQAGGNMADDTLIFHEDGTFTGWSFDWETEALTSETQGTWAVTEYDPAWNLYWNNPPYELTLTYDNGRVNIKGLTLEDPWLSLTYYEGGGGYLRPEDAELFNEE